MSSRRLIGLVALFAVGLALGLLGSFAARGDERGPIFDVRVLCGRGTYEDHFGVGQAGDVGLGMRIEIVYRSTLPAAVDDDRDVRAALVMALPEGWSLYSGPAVSPPAPDPIVSWQDDAGGGVLIPVREQALLLHGRAGSLVRYIRLKAKGEAPTGAIVMDAAMLDADGALLERRLRVPCTTELLPPRRAGSIGSGRERGARGTGLRGRLRPVATRGT